jgi:hypothetical protein
MRMRHAAVALTLTVLAACSAQSGDQTPAPQSAADCQGKWAIQVQNDTYESVEVQYTHGTAGALQRAGTVDAQNNRTFFIRSVPIPEVWVLVGTVRIYPHDRAGQSRARVYIGLGCDTRS